MTPEGGIPGMPDLPEDHPMMKLFSTIQDSIINRDKEILMNDWTRFIVIFLWIDWCCRQPNPRKAGRELIASWVQRLDPTKQKDEILAAFGGMDAEPDTLARLQDSVSDISAMLLNVLNMGADGGWSSPPDGF